MERVGKGYQGQSLNCRDGRDLSQHHTGSFSVQKGKLRPREREKGGRSPRVRYHLQRSSYPLLGTGAGGGSGWAGQAEQPSPRLIRKCPPPLRRTPRILPTRPRLILATPKVAITISSVQTRTLGHREVDTQGPLGCQAKRSFAFRSV